MMAVIATIGLVQFRSVERAGSRWKINLWSIIYGLFIAAALLGTVHHGFEIPTTIYDATWLGILLSLGIMIGLFVVALALDLLGRAWALRILPLMLLVATGFFVYSIMHGQDFSLFLAYEALALMLALAGWAWLAVRAEPGALSMALGVLVTIIAAIVQASGAVSYTFIVPFDHNANYHLLQCVGVMLLTDGIRRSTSTDYRDNSFK